jgi:putative inorganic carbon (HCO3(-)) transporter
LDIVKESFILSLFTRLYAAAKGSETVRLSSAFSSGIKKLWFGSALSEVLSRQGRLSADWEKSMAFRFLTGLINFIPRSLGRLYNLCREIFEESIIMRAAWYCGENACIFISWAFLAALVIPYDYWNNVYSFAGMLLILAAFYIYGMRNSSAALEVKSIGVYAVAFAAFELLFVFLSYDKSESIRFFTYHFSCMLAVLLIVGTVRSTKQLVRIIDFSLAGTGIASLYAIVQRLQGIEVNKSYVDLSVNANMPGRVYSFFFNPNSFAMLLVMMLPVSAVLIFYSKGYKRLFYLLVFAAATIALLMTYTRAAWGGFVLSILVMALIIRPILVPLFVLAGIFALPLMPASIYNRVMTIFSSKDTSITSRKPIYDAAWRLILKNPVIGAGLGYEVVKTKVMDIGLYKGVAPFVHAHSIYLQIAAELGVFGLLAFLGTIFSGVKNGLKAIFGKKGSKLLQGIIAAQISAFAGIMLCSWVDYPWSFPRVMLMFWFSFAILVSAVKLANQEEAE